MTVVRDPDTGQFQSVKSGAGVDRFRDYEFVHVKNEYVVPAADLPGAFPVEVSDITTVEMDDVLDRDERADLVALNLHALQASVPGTTSAEASLNAGWELTLGAGDEMVLEEDQATEIDADGTVVNAHRAKSDNPDILYHAFWNAEGGFADSTNGLGGGPDAPIITDNVHYPRDYGACPDLDERDELTESIHLDDEGGADISDSLINLDVSYTVVFAVEELDRRR